MHNNIFKQLYHSDLKSSYINFDGMVLNDVVGQARDLLTYFDRLRQRNKKNKQLFISYHNPIWDPVLEIASSLGLRKKIKNQNWLDQDDLKNILELSGYKVLKSYKRFFGITTITIAEPSKLRPSINKRYSVSIIVPARNEKGNIQKIVPSFPKFGRSQEFIFVEGGSKDKTWEMIKKEEKKYKNIRLFKQIGKGKADAVRLGFEKAKGDILMIYDADRTVAASDLEKFYNVLASGMGRFVNGSRLVYPMEDDAMRFLNKIGNKFFSLIFTWILGARFKDTLCGTKALFRKDFVRYHKDYIDYLKNDPFGDFALIFTAIKNNLKVVEIPIRYKERVYGSTNINRFYHGMLLFKMAIQALIEFKL